MKKLFVFGLLLTIYSCKEMDPAEPGLLVPKTVDQDASLPSIYVNNTQLHAETFGNPNDPMIIALHGGPGADYRSMLNCKDFAAEGYYVVFYDQRGTGLSKRYDKSVYNVRIMIDDLDAVIQHYRRSQEQKVFLFGHSWGAMLATAYINEHPAKVNGAVLAEPGGFTWPQTKEYLDKSQQLSLFSESTNDAVYDEQVISGSENQQDLLDYKLALSSSHDFAKGNKLGIEGPFPFWRNGAVSAFRFREIAVQEGFDFTGHLNQFTTKVLFAYSELNLAYGVQHAKDVSSAYPNVELTEVKGTGHEMIYFGWNNFYPAALTYLNSLK